MKQIFESSLIYCFCIYITKLKICLCNIGKKLGWCDRTMKKGQKNFY